MLSANVIATVETIGNLKQLLINTKNLKINVSSQDEIHPIFTASI